MNEYSKNISMIFKIVFIWRSDKKCYSNSFVLFTFSIFRSFWFLTKKRFFCFFVYFFQQKFSFFKSKIFSFSLCSNVHFVIKYTWKKYFFLLLNFWKKCFSFNSFSDGKKVRRRETFFRRKKIGKFRITQNIETNFSFPSQEK